MQPNYEPQEYQEYDEGHVQPIHHKKVGFWEKIGGGSLSIAILVHVILLVAGAFVIFKYTHHEKKDPDFGVKGGSRGGGSERSLDQAVRKKAQAQITPNNDIKKVVAEGVVSKIIPQNLGINFGESTPLTALAGGGSSGGKGGLGEGDGLMGNGPGGGIGKKSGLGPGGIIDARVFVPLLPEQMRKRCSKEDRLQRLKENGGTPECEEAVVKALRWLKTHQNSDGSWGNANKPAMTGLALLAYFGHCETPISEEFGESCLRGIVYLVGEGMKNDGRMASNFTANSWVYEHGIATYALGEAATFCKDLKIEVPSLMEITEKAGQFIIDNQNENGGWAYAYATYKGHTDTSVAGWQIQALKACSHTDIKYRGMNSAIDKGLKYMLSCQNENGGFGYAGPGAPAGKGKFFSLTGVGCLCLQMWGKGNSSDVRKGIKYIKENAKLDWNTEDSDLYSHYYMSQAMMQAGGANWTAYNDLFRDQVLKNQNADGSWKPTGFNGHGGSNDVYRTALCTLMLEVYYRFLSTGGGGGSRERDRPGI